MKCTNCEKRKAVIDLKYGNQKLCKNCFLEYHEKKVRKTIKISGMLNKKDKIGVAVSGGKDSLGLLYLLKKFRYDVEAISIDEGIKGYRDKSLQCVKRFCKKNKIPLHIYSFKDEFGFDMDWIAKKRNKRTCSYCGVFRRTLLNKVARELGFDKIAVGHNLDDETQMILMNLFRGELCRLARSGPITGIIKHPKFTTRVKPLRERTEKEDVVYALLRGIEYFDEDCPYRGYAYRNSIRKILNELEEKRPGTKISLLHSFDKMLPFLREYFLTDEVPNECEECGELTAGNLCKTCEMKKELTSLL